jgi:hypothetical protein
MQVEGSQKPRDTPYNGYSYLYALVAHAHSILHLYARDSLLRHLINRVMGLARYWR